ncbi:MAG: glycerophosphodiester phosphodiesterase family protein [Deltaproteobacteria bacterium]|nr:glycerophosphodiester phosphodiesterase family protein [Deltaproteobacteria bacterium]MCW9050091.1 glycerophosphodiester phosphodiesterase family protein [Deltaproteobacteria bacterium]
MNLFFERFSGSGYICAHRGARSIAPENTVLALEQARLCGADLWETDVRLSADGELVLFHDQTLERTTDVAALETLYSRKPWKLSDFSFEELCLLNAGSWFLRDDPFGTIASGEVGGVDVPKIKAQKIPLLNETLRYSLRHDFPLNLEIKDQSATAGAQLVVDSVLKQLRETGTESLVLISSFNHDYLRLLKQLNPNIATAALVEDSHPENLIDYLQDLAVEAYHPDQLITDADLINELTSKGIRVNLWTVNDIQRARHFFAAGATFICTDWPQHLVADRHSA